MASVMNEMDDQIIARQIQELQEEAERAVKLSVHASNDTIHIDCQIPGEERPSTKITIGLQENERRKEQVMTAVGEILAQDHAKLHHFHLTWLDNENIGYPQFWRGLAANRILKELYFRGVTFPDEPAATLFLTNLALESLNMTSCSISDGTFGSFCHAIQSSRIKELKIHTNNRAAGIAWPLLWSALEHGATRLESLRVDCTNGATRGFDNGFESFLTNNTNIQSLCLQGCHWNHDSLPFFVALGRGLIVNTSVKILKVPFHHRSEINPTIEEILIQTMFSEGLDQNMAVDSLTVKTKVSPETANALVDGLEQMTRNRANAATRGGHDQEESLPVLKEIGLLCNGRYGNDDPTTDATRDLFFDRLSRSDVIRVEKVVFDLSLRRQMLSSKMYDFIRSTQVTKSLTLGRTRRRPIDNTFVDLADAMEANNSISELKAGREEFNNTTTNLLSSPNKYRIRCQLRRNEIQVHTLRKNENLSLLPLVLARLLSSEDRPTNEKERSEIEASLLVGRTIVFEMLKDIPALFAVYGKRKRDD